MGPLHALPEVVKEVHPPARPLRPPPPPRGGFPSRRRRRRLGRGRRGRPGGGRRPACERAGPRRVRSRVRARHVVHATESKGAQHARTVISTGAGANAAVRESFVGFTKLDRFSALTNARTTCSVGAGATLTHVLDGNEAEQAHIHHATAVCARDGAFQSRTLSDAGALSRVCVDCDVAGAGAFFDFSGVQLGGSDQNLDLRTALTHSSPDADSAQDIRNVAAENARLVFKGRIDVPQLGQRTNADQLCRSLVLDDGAAVDAMPSLEIVADDVKCTHARPSRTSTPSSTSRVAASREERGRSIKALLRPPEDGRRGARGTSRAEADEFEERSSTGGAVLLLSSSRRRFRVQLAETLATTTTQLLIGVEFLQERKMHAG